MVSPMDDPAKIFLKVYAKNGQFREPKYGKMTITCRLMIQIKHGWIHLKDNG